MLSVTQKKENKKIIYEFISRGTSYTVIKESGKFEVWSERISANFGPKVALYDSLEEMAKRSKALKNLAILISV